MSNYIDLPAFGNVHWKAPVVLTSSLPISGNSIGDVKLAEDTNTIYVWNGSSWIAVATPGAAIAIDGLLGDVTATGPGVVAATVNLVGGSAAASVNTATVLVNTAQSGNKFLASPANGSSGAPAFRTIVNADLPNAATTTKTGNYTITSSDSIIFVDMTSGPFTLTLPDPSTVTGKIYRIIGTTGTMSTNNLTLARFGSEKIEGLSASKVFQTDWGFWQVVSNGTDWFVG